MAKKKQIPDRTTVPLEGIKDDLANYWQIAGIDEDVWEHMPIPQRLLLMAKRGVKAAAEALDEMED